MQDGSRGIFVYTCGHQASRELVNAYGKAPWRYFREQYLRRSPRDHWKIVLGGGIAGVTERPDYRALGNYFNGPREAAHGFFARKRDSQGTEELPVLSGK